MNRFASLFLVIVLGGVWLFQSGCAIRAQQLKSQPLNHSESVPNALQTNKKFLIYPLEDLRGGQYGALYPTTLIPIVNFFHLGGWNRYPETSGVLRSSQGGAATVTVGSLPSAFPYLLANMMRDMRHTSNATPIDQINTRINLNSFDFVVMGKLRTTRITQHINIVPLAFLAILGAPYIFVDAVMEFEVSVFRSGNMTKPVYSKTYSFAGSRIVGLYYNHSAHFDLFIGALENMISEAVMDIARNTSK